MPERINEEESFDILADVLDTMRLRGTIFFHSELAAPWGLVLAKMGVPRFHIALAGTCVVGANTNEPIGVSEMDVVMLPNGNEHWIADQPGRSLIQSERASEACELGSPLFQTGEITNRLMCGLVQYDTDMSHPIMDTFPEILHLTNLHENESIWLTIMSIDAKMTEMGGHGSRVVDKLTEVLILQLLNRHVKNNNEATGFLAALGDRRVQRALSLIHRMPAYDWTLASLGAESGMSRATLIRSFDASIGISPIAYLTNWRLVKAYSEVKYSTATIQQIAELVGFKSASTLTKAFRSRYGRTPSKLRQEG